MSRALNNLLKRIRACELCIDELPLGPRPIVQASASARVLVVGQAPGTKVHKTGVPFNDPSGDRLREWMGITSETFYDDTQVALVPMGFCYPGRGKSGDLPPIPRCADTWREALLKHLQQIEVTICVGAYAHAWHLPKVGKTLTDTVREWRDFAPDVIPAPHPSPRNNMWLRRNPWFEDEVVPYMQERVSSALEQTER